MKHRVAVIIPCRKGSSARVTLKTLGKQTYQDFDVYAIQDDELRGQAWALNQGLDSLRRGDHEFVLFSDDDIQWYPPSLELLVATLDAHPEASYSYGAYSMGSKVQCNCSFDAAMLRQVNYISTMSLVRLSDAVRFDETLVRLIDWDFWLTMLSAGRVGVYCGQAIFTTAVRQGITELDKANNRLRKEAVAQKHAIPLETVL